MGKLLLPAIIAMLLCCVNSAQAISTFSPNCTLPAANITRALYVSAPNVRGTLEILWTSVATIIACTYSVLHLNVPRQRDGRRADWKDDLKWSIKDSATKALWFLKVLFAPEVYLLNALQQYRAAKRLQRKLHSLDDGVYDGRQWSLGECFYVNMGGYAVSLREDAKPRQARQLWAKSFIYLLTREPSLVLPKLLNHAELADRSKRDVFTRSIILLQISFFVATLVSRWVKKLPVTPLEVATLAFTICSTCTYLLYWHKPQGVSTPTTILYFERDLPQGLRQVLVGEDSCRLDRPIIYPLENKHPPLEATSAEAFAEQSVWASVLALGPLLFGGVHMIAWNANFPTTVDRWIWRVAALMTMLAGTPAWMINGLFSFSSFNDITPRIDLPILVCCVASYISARLATSIEMFRSLGYLPPDAYITSWTTNVPHLD